MIVVETLFLTAVLSAFVGLIALMALTSRAAQRSERLEGSLFGVVLTATIAAVAAFLLYARSPHEAARQSVYGQIEPAAPSSGKLGPSHGLLPKRL